MDTGPYDPPYYEPACERTLNSYPELLAADQNATDFRFPAPGRERDGRPE